MVETIWDTRFFKPVSSVVTSSRATSAFSARCVSSVFSSAQVFFLAVKLVLNFSVSARLNWSLESADLISASWSANRVLTSVNWEPNSDRAFYKTYTGVSRLKLQVIKVQVSSTMHRNTTWHLGANAWYSESFSRLSQIAMFIGIVMKLSTGSFMINWAGTWWLQVKFILLRWTFEKLREKVSIYIIKSTDHPGSSSEDLGAGRV